MGLLEGLTPVFCSSQPHRPCSRLPWKRTLLRPIIPAWPITRPQPSNRRRTGLTRWPAPTPTLPQAEPCRGRKRAPACWLIWTIAQPSRPTGRRDPAQSRRRAASRQGSGYIPGPNDGRGDGLRSGPRPGLWRIRSEFMRSMNSACSTWSFSAGWEATWFRRTGYQA